MSSPSPTHLACKVYACQPGKIVPPLTSISFFQSSSHPYHTGCTDGGNSVFFNKQNDILENTPFESVNDQTTIVPSTIKKLHQKRELFNSCEFRYLALKKNRKKMIRSGNYAEGSNKARSQAKLRQVIGHHDPQPDCGSFSGKPVVCQ